MMLLMLLASARRSGRPMTCDAKDAAAAGGLAQQERAHDAADAPCACAEERDVYDMRCYGCRCHWWHAEAAGA